ncbi:MAG: hypothetical protein PIR02_02545 [Microbacterium enclense]
MPEHEREGAGERSVDRRALLALGGTVAGGAAAFAVTDGFAWAEPTIRRAIGVPTDAASVDGQLAVAWSRPDIELLADIVDGPGTLIWRAFTGVTILNNTNKSGQIALTITRTRPTLSASPWENYGAFFPQAQATTETTQLWLTQSSAVRPGDSVGTDVLIATNEEPEGAFTAQFTATAVFLKGSTPPPVPAELTVRYNG